ncbi:MAG: hypothetical protein K5864_08485 [Bacteroidales bacterium]|nr:hypothetical protein [Bacteroidales bacterium]
MSKKKSIKKIRRSAAAGFYGTMLAIVAAITLHYMDDRIIVISATEATQRSLLLIGIVLVIAQWVIYARLYRTTLRDLPQLKQSEQRLSIYAKAVSIFYFCTFVICILLSFIVVFSDNMILLLFPLLLFMLLLMHYPNMYRIKVEAGLDDSEMKELYGNKYYADEDTTTPNTDNQ